jgi:HNH endonuclease
VTGFATPGGLKALADPIKARPGSVTAIVIGAATYPGFQALDELASAGVPLNRLHVHLGRIQAIWLQYDHLLPHARGGSSDLSNIVVTCAPCNNGRCNLTIEEVGLSDPRLREPIRSTWDGLERVRCQ